MPKYSGSLGSFNSARIGIACGLLVVALGLLWLLSSIGILETSLPVGPIVIIITGIALIIPQLENAKRGA